MSKLHSLAISSLSSVALAAFAFIGCGGGTPPPRPAEVAMDPSSGGSTPSSDPTTTAADTSAPSSAADPSAAMMGASDPGAATPAATASSDPPDPKSGKGGKAGKGKKGAAASAGGGQLSKSDCQAIADKGVDLFIAGTDGLDPSMAAQIKATAASDPNMSGMTSECLKSTTRAQYKCAMAATTKADWQTCLK